MIGNGAFASLLHNVLAAAQLRYAGEETVAGRKAVRIDFVLPRSTKSLTVSLQQGQGVVGQEGSLWADAASLDLIAVDSHVTEIPPYLPLVDSETNMKYARMRIGQYDVVMAQEAESHMMGTDGVESFNRIEFTHCRAYSAQSEIRFDAPAPASGDSVTGSARPPEKEAARVVEPFMLMPMELTTPVSDRDAVGTLIEARVREDVLRKGAVAIPKGSVVRGRVRRMERYRDGNAYIVALEFSEVEVRGVSMPFYAGLLRIEKNPRIRMELRERVVVPGGGTQEQRVTLPELAGVAPFFVSGEAVSLPRGFQMEWRTRGPIAGVDKK
jgi:hypothetical protein